MPTHHPSPPPVPSPVEEVVGNLGVHDHPSLGRKDLVQSRDAVGDDLHILVPQHLVQYVHQVQLYEGRGVGGGGSEVRGEVK